MAEEKEVTLEDVLLGSLDFGKVPSTEEPEEPESKEDSEKETETDDPELNVEEILGSSAQTDTAGEEEDVVGVDEGVTKDGGETPVHDSSEDEKPSDTQESTTLLFARFLSEQGNLTSFNEDEFKKLIEEKGEDEALSSLWNKEAEAIRNNLLETYDQDVREYLDMLDTGVAPDVARNISKAKQWISNIDKESLESDDKESLRKDLIKQRYKVTTSFSDAKIDKLVDRAVSLGEDIEEATEALEDLSSYYEQQIKKEKEAVKQAEEQHREASKKQLEDFKKQVNELKEVIPGMELTPKQKQNIIEKLTKPVKEINGQPVNAVYAKRAEDPFKFDTILAALDDVGVFDGKWDKLTKRVKTDTINKLKKSLDSTSQRTRTGAYNTGGDTVQRNIESMRTFI